MTTNIFLKPKDGSVVTVLDAMEKAGLVKTELSLAVMAANDRCENALFELMDSMDQGYTLEQPVFIRVGQVRQVDIPVIFSVGVPVDFGPEPAQEVGPERVEEIDPYPYLDEEPGERCMCAVVPSEGTGDQAPINGKPDEDQEPVRRCEHCGDELVTKRKAVRFCSKPECKSARKKAYMAEWHKTHKQQEEAEAGKFEQILNEVDAGKKPGDAWPNGTTWLLASTGAWMTEHQLLHVLAEKSLLPGTLLKNKAKGWHQVSAMYEMEPVELTGVQAEHWRYSKIDEEFIEVVDHE